MPFYLKIGIWLFIVASAYLVAALLFYPRLYTTEINGVIMQPVRWGYFHVIIAIAYWACTGVLLLMNYLAYRKKRKESQEHLKVAQQIVARKLKSIQKKN